ncbi:MAG: Uma2 family endonuclease [Anaerolineae bacterium]|nr:Uma2 family endonuclease [Anaerolineae bacterium]
MLSPTDHAADVLDKVSNYLTAKVTVWVIDPIKQTVRVFTSNAAPRLFTANSVLEGGEILLGFSLPVSSIFEGL